MKLTEGSAPNTLWSYWESDSSILPPIVETCHRSWSGVGSFASVHLLMPEDLPKYLSSNDLPSRFQEMPPVKRANPVRLALLSRHGGYWVDAGVLTKGPVDDWVKPKASSHGFFVFQDVDRSRILDTWFISGTPHSAFLREWRIRYQKFFDRRRIHEAHSLHKTPFKTRNSHHRGSKQATTLGALKDCCLGKISARSAADVPLFHYALHS